MKFTLSWLKEHLDTTATVDEIAEALTDLGLEVEEIVNPLDKLAPFTLAKVVSAEQHPDADRLRVCMVQTDEGEKQIVCGAPNARAGITVVLAKPGDYVPGIDTTLSVGKIRGVESHGMMASERELELSDEHEGIIELPSGEVGQSFADWLAQNRPEAVDPLIEIAITPNRPDALGVHGIARDLAARGLGTLKPLKVERVEGTFDSPVKVSISEDALGEGGCHVFQGRYIRGVKNGPSPAWLQRRLKSIGLRPISALVDITNFFTHDRNRPLHVFDADKLAGDLTICRAEGGEEMLALDGKTYAMPAGAVVFKDGNGVENVGGIMGGEETGCSDETVNVLLEAAYWDHVQVATTGRALKINSDARYRNERGIDPGYNRQAVEDATAMIVAQTVLVTPIVAALSRSAVAELMEEFDETLRALHANRIQRIATLLVEARPALITAALAGLGRAFAEVGAVMIVGGNINHATRVMTTAITLETSRGALDLALALGLILLALTLALNAMAMGLRPRPVGGLTYGR